MAVVFYCRRVTLQYNNSCSNFIASTLDDASHPLFPNYNHWVIWNIPVLTKIPKGIAHGETVSTLGGAVQDIAYGKHQYKVSKPPFQQISHLCFYGVYVRLHAASRFFQ